MLSTMRRSKFCSRVLKRGLKICNNTITSEKLLVFDSIKLHVINNEAFKVLLKSAQKRNKVLRYNEHSWIVAVLWKNRLDVALF